MVQPSYDDARSVLRARFGYDQFRPPQEKAIRAILSRRDALIVLPTGGGKSICFQVPALLFPGLTIVVSPLISLMADQVQALQRRGIAAEYLNSTLATEETASRVARLRRGEIKLLYVAPERLTIGPTSDLLRRLDIALLAVDEAHCVSEWGQDFRPSYLQLARIRSAIGARQTVALTATATPRVRRDVCRLLALTSPIEVVTGFDRPNLRFAVERVAQDQARSASLVRHLRAQHEPSVVYAATRRQVELVVRILVRSRVAAVGYHAGLPPERRARAQDAFMSGATPTIVATNAFGMGIDKSDVRLVLHYTMSGSLEDYYQEAGRAGRDGAVSRCVLLFHRGDRCVHDRMRDASRPGAAVVRRLWDVVGREHRRAGSVVLDPDRLGRLARPAVEADRAARALEFLREHALLEVPPDDGVRRVRCLATALRLACEANSLTREARLVLERMVDADRETGGWIPVSAAALEFSLFALDRALEELEGRQLVYVERAVPVARVASGPRSDYSLERALAHLTVRQAAQRAKLDAMVGYATTTSCRRGFILRYFGDRTSPMLPTSCARCDNCEA